MKAYSFGKLKDGRTAGLYIIKNSCGMEASITDYGASLVSLVVPDARGGYRDVVLGHDDVSGYETGQGYIGATVGRFANRIGGARIEISGKSYDLTANHGPNALHGGRDPYGERIFTVRIPFTEMKSLEIMKAYALESLNDRWPSAVQESINGDSVSLTLESPDMDQGFPGNLRLEVTYTLTEDNELHIDYKASCDKDTALNLTNHSYFNLNGDAGGSVLGQICCIRSDRFVPTDEFSLPTGEVWDVDGTPMDFRVPKALGRDIDEDYEQLRYGGGYDHNYVIGDNKSCPYREVASLFSEESGIRMSVLTDLPGLQLYTANGLADEPGKRGTVYGPRCAVCFETQYWPDAVSREDFPGGILRGGEEFRSRTTYKFSFQEASK